MNKHFCVVCGRQIVGKHSVEYCKKHHHQLKTYGRFLDNNPRTKFDPNEFRFIGDDTVEFDTYDSLGNVVATYKIDAEDYPIVSQFKWRTVKGYASYGDKAHYLHRLVLDAKPGQAVDHINGGKTDNRKSNLRIVSPSVNLCNRKGYGKHGIKGVEYHKSLNKWSAYMRIENKQYHSPCYQTQEEAVFARYILEQMFCPAYLEWHTKHLTHDLTIEQKRNVIETISKKFS